MKKTRPLTFFSSIVIFLLLLNFVNAEIYTPQHPCGTNKISYEKNDLIIENNCIKAKFPEQYDPAQIIMIDKFNKNQPFKLAIDSITEKDKDTTKLTQETKLFSANKYELINDNTIKYSNDYITLFYNIYENKVEISANINNQPKSNPNTNLWLKYEIKTHREGTIIFEQPEVDGIKQEIQIETTKENEIDYIYEKIGDGNSIIIDPIYQVDYSPIPAQLLAGGNATTYNDSQFTNITDITTPMTNNLTDYEVYPTVNNATQQRAITGSWTETYDNQSQWYLRMYRTSSLGSPYICQYNDSNNISTCTFYIDAIGTGWRNYNVTAQMQYMKNTKGLNFTKLRIFTSTIATWSEMRLRAEGNDTTPPTINNCWTDNNSIGCNGTAQWTCNITDNLDVANVIFTINGTNQSAIQNDQLWYYSITFNDTSTTNITLTLTNVYAYDITNLSNQTTPNLTIGHYCEVISCIENWTEQYGICLTNDTILKTYYDNNGCNTTNNLPLDNGTYVYCNYCSEDLEMILGECQEYETQNVTYTDNNYYTCCVVTGLISDCSIIYTPYNETYTQNCTYYTKQFNCTADTTPVLNDKINLVCIMPDNQSYCCVVNTYQQNKLLATTPEYKEATSSIFTLSGQQETRTCFNPSQNLLNAYYTKKELRPNNAYKIEVLCTSNNGTQIIYQTPINPEYHQTDWVVYRLKWFGEKPITYIITFIVLIIIILGIIFLIKKARGH